MLISYVKLQTSVHEEGLLHKVSKQGKHCHGALGKDRARKLGLGLDRGTKLKHWIKEGSPAIPLPAGSSYFGFHLPQCWICRPWSSPSVCADCPEADLLGVHSKWYRLNAPQSQKSLSLQENHTPKPTSGSDPNFPSHQAAAQHLLSAQMGSFLFMMLSLQGAEPHDQAPSRPTSPCFSLTETDLLY